MSDFRTKLLGIAALAIATAGLSSAQTIITCVNNGSNVGGIIVGSGGQGLNPATLRLESQTELAQDITTIPGTCSATVPVPNAIVYVTLSATVTSKLINATTGQTDAAFVVNGGTPVYGTIFGANQLVFSGVTFPMGAFNFEIYNVRVDASTSTSTSVTESVNIEYVSNPNTTGSANLITPPLQVGFIQQSLSFTLASMGGNGNSAKTFNSYTVCAGNPLPLSSTQNYLISVNGVAGVTNLSFLLNINELVPGAFKQAYSNLAPQNANGPVPTAGGENGSYVSGSIGTATGPTNIVVTLANVPSSATVYLPYSTTAGTVANPITLTLVNTGALTGSQFSPNATYSGGAYANLPAPNSIGAGAAALGNVVAFTPTNGGVVATYAVSVTAPIPAGQQTFALPVEMTFAKNSTSATTNAVTALVAYAPAAAALTGPATSIPTFALSSVTPIPASVINPCQTTLLFPYVTNYQGTYETGIAIANTTTDNLGPANASSATPTNGVCTINFYGNQAQPAAFTTPTVGAWSTAAGSPSPVYANILTTMSGLTNFTGYAIAYCNFLDAHGFAFITDYTVGGADAFAQGYLAVVVPNPRTVADSGAGTGNGE